MKIAFRETGNFTASIQEYFGGDAAYFPLQDFLGATPERGAVIQGTGGLRKLRWPDPRRVKGKRGGLRIIYLHIPAARLIVLLDVYDKDEQDDFSTQDKKGVCRARRSYSTAVGTGRRLGTMSEATIPSQTKRPPLAERLRGALEETLAWTQNEGEARVTRMQEDGSRVRPQNMKRAQFEAERSQHQAKQRSTTSEAYTLIQELLAWTGREPSTEETVQVDTLRERAEAFLHQSEAIAG